MFTVFPQIAFLYQPFGSYDFGNSDNSVYKVDGNRHKVSHCVQLHNLLRYTDSKER